MANTTKSRTNANYVSTFKAAINRGTPFAVAISNIAKRAGKNESVIYNHLYKHGAINRRKVGGEWMWWPNFNRSTGRKPSNTQFKNFSFQQIVAWAIATGYCTPEQVNNLKSQKDFYNFFGPFIASQFNWSVSSGWTASKVKSFSPNGKATTAKRTRKTTGKAKTRRAATTKNSRKRTTTRAKSTRRATATKSTKRAVANKSAKRAVATKSVKRTTAAKARTRTTTARGRKNTAATAVRNYRFPKAGSSSTSRTYRRAA